ncbi:hypothetical protein CHUAL_008617 [Chamberlinius hualienensis]
MNSKLHFLLVAVGATVLLGFLNAKTLEHEDPKEPFLARFGFIECPQCVDMFGGIGCCILNFRCCNYNETEDDAGIEDDGGEK